MKPCSLCRHWGCLTIMSLLLLYAIYMGSATYIDREHLYFECRKGAQEATQKQWDAIWGQVAPSVERAQRPPSIPEHRPGRWGRP